MTTTLIVVAVIALIGLLIYTGVIKYFFMALGDILEAVFDAFN